MFKILQCSCLLLYFAVAVAAAAAAATPSPSERLAIRVSTTTLPYRARIALGDAPNLTLGDLVRYPPEHFSPEVAAAINGYLKPFNLRLGLPTEHVDRFARTGHPAPAERPADPAPAPSHDPLDTLSLPLRTKLNELKITSAADFSARFTYSRMYQLNMRAPYWDEMLDFCLDQRSPVASGAELSNYTCEQFTGNLSVRGRKFLAHLHVTDPADLARKFSLLTMRDEGVALRTMQELMDWAETCGTPIAVTERERLANCRSGLKP